MMTVEEKQKRLEQRREAREKAKKAAQEQAEREQKHVSSMKINIEWKKSYMWGSNPHAEVWVTYKDGTSEYANGFTASGCGYCKESTVIAEIFNKLRS